MEYRDCWIKPYFVTRDFVIIAKQGYGKKDWRAYAGLLTNKQLKQYEDGNTDDAFRTILEDGQKVKRPLAEFLFPEFAKKYTWRG